MSFLMRRMTQIGSQSRYIFTTATSYEDVIRALNTLQTNAEYLRTTKTNHSSGSKSLHAMKKYLIRSGLTLEDVDTLSVIHVSGTKGKGSTCAFAEAILRNYGYKTGFYSSPHLIHVTERIRINGKPIDEEIFTKYFWHVYNKLNSLKENDSDMPTYFKFITVLMFHIFFNSDIDVVILEVGIGGEYDCTNIVRRPICVGVTSLGLEHTSLLGNTLEDIARQKSGIFKKNTIAFTVPQPKNAMDVIEEKAIERNCSLYIVPDFKSYKWNGDPPVLGIATDIQEENASLAVQLAHTWILETTKSQFNKTQPSCVECGKSENLNQNESVELESLNYKSSTFSNESPVISFAKTAFALSSCTWPGRAQVLCGKNIDFYLDGAHTYESMGVCVSWYSSKVKDKAGSRFLIFNVTGDRDVSKLLDLLKYLEFEKVYFVPNVSGEKLKLDQLELKTTSDYQQNRCWKNFHIWDKDNAIVLNSVKEALAHIDEHRNKSLIDLESEIKRPQVLITGSLHLIGAALLLLDPNLTMKTDF